MTKKYIYNFTEGDGKNKILLGGKGANLCEMTQIGLRVPPGFVITTEACLDFIANNRLPEGIMASVRENMAWLEQAMGKQFGGADNPLLVSVRSGSAMSMPGMMDTILNLGLNEATLAGLIKLTGNERFAYDAYRRFIQLFGKIALGIDDHFFDNHFEAIKRRAGVKVDVGLSAEDLRDIGQLFLQVVHEQTGRPFPQDPYEQLELAIKAVFGSWMGRRAVDYRREFKITPDMANGTAVNVQAMVFGNMGNDCATGVGFTRDPGTGENVMYGEYLVNAQGEDVVAGIRTPKPVAEMKDEIPKLYTQLVELRNKLENHYGEVQDYEYTIEKGILYCLQTRNGKMNAQGMVRSSVEMANEGLDQPREGLAAHRSRAAGAVVVSPPRPRAQGRVGRAGHGCLAGGVVRQDRVRRRHRGKARARGRREDHPGARRDQAGRHSRLFLRGRHSDQSRRQDLARGGGGARHGQALRGGRGRHCGQRPSASGDYRR
jgi:pyruvate, orthophosphate dikinase